MSELKSNSNIKDLVTNTEVIIKDLKDLDNNLCIAVKTNNEKCSQHVKNTEVYCNRHYNLNIKKSKILNINDMFNDENYKLLLKNGSYIFQTNEKKKRGRRRKYEISEKFYNDEYITVWPEIVAGEKLLVDNNNNVYTFDLSTPKYLGKKTVEAKLVRKK